MKREKIDWPSGARCASVLTFNLDAEYVWKGLAQDSDRRPKTLSLGKYGMKRGLHRVLQALRERSLTATFFVPGAAALQYRKEITDIVEEGHEIGLHGYEHEDFSCLDYDEIKRLLEAGCEALIKTTGTAPVGFRVPEGEMNQHLYEAMAASGFLYSSSMLGDDRPYLVQTEKQNKKIVEIPAPWELYDFLYFGFNYTPAFPAGQGRIANYSQVLGIFREEFRAYYRYGLCYVPQFDPQTIGTPGRIPLLEEIIKTIAHAEGTWIGTGCEMASWWLENHR